MRFTVLCFLSASILMAQRPVIQAGGVRNGASYGKGYVPGSIVSIFGTNLAAKTELASTTPLPTILAGTAVTFGGAPAFLLYVSPTQINLQVPYYGGEPIYVPAPIVVTTVSGSSDPYPDPTRAPDFGDSIVGLFTSDRSGCGQALALNVDGGTGATSVNSRSNGASPGDFISLYGTGLCCYVPGFPRDGLGKPTPLSPLYAGATGSAFAALDLLRESGIFWQGLAPGLIGVDQFNLKISPLAREGCAVPVLVNSYGTSKPVTVAIRKGGGPCADPPVAGYGEITWQRSSPRPGLPSPRVVHLRLDFRPRNSYGS